MLTPVSLPANTGNLYRKVRTCTLRFAHVILGILSVQDYSAASCVNLCVISAKNNIYVLICVFYGNYHCKLKHRRVSTTASTIK